ncbi:hypothetical protein BC938DRAFT_474123 [Jimgerdemannia flammicorona]|uniref:Uncharacterized protein n=1 Tax=Jimgerdemannia flammicorona TaxID=994334 RepID=A0A433Q2Q7_9FUNG|nr:hypothetical protein BC938DRAFT_474123 [Jimgerdemannia flammicorona]
MSEVAGGGEEVAEAADRGGREGGVEFESVKLAIGKNTSCSTIPLHTNKREGKNVKGERHGIIICIDGKDNLVEELGWKTGTGRPWPCVSEEGFSQLSDMVQ